MDHQKSTILLILAHFLLVWRACNIKKIKTDELCINEPISWTRRTQNISKNQNLYLYQSRIAFPVWTLLSRIWTYCHQVSFCMKLSDFEEWKGFWGQERVLETGNRDLQISWKLSSVQYVSPYLLKKIDEIWKRTPSTRDWTRVLWLALQRC